MEKKIIKNANSNSDDITSEQVGASTDEIASEQIAAGTEKITSEQRAACTEESLFENTTTCTQLLWKELFMKQAKSRLPRTIVLDVIALSLLFMYFFMEDEIVFAIVFAVICIGANILEFYYLPTKQAKMSYKRAMDLYHMEQTYQTVVYPDHLFLRNVQTKGELNLTYDKIMTLLDTKHTYLLKLKQKQFLMIQKDGFTKGTVLDFVNFIESKDIPRKF